jgi:hypothetical protein
LLICFSKQEALASITYSYKHGFSGFAAMLTDDQAQDLAGVLIVILGTESFHYPWPLHLDAYSQILLQVVGPKKSYTNQKV